MKRDDVTADRLAVLNAGTAESAVLTECLKIDFAALMRAAFPDAAPDMLHALEHAEKDGITRRMALAAALLIQHFGPTILPRLQTHPSDTVRGWACFVIGGQTDLGLEERLAAIRPLADDTHFGVREWSWLALRPHLAADLDASIARLAPWTAAPSPFVRRFASESIRPRGVWCAHLPILKKNPEKGLPILEPLRADPEPYVQDSVANWLNDAAKDQPDWVEALCARWLAESPVPATQRICKRAQRSLGKKS